MFRSFVPRVVLASLILGNVMLSYLGATNPAIDTTPGPLVVQPMDPTKAYFPTTGTFWDGGQTLSKITLQVKGTKTGSTDTLSEFKEYPVTSGYGQSYSGGVLTDYDSTRSYYLRAHLYNDDGIAIAQSGWQAVPQSL
jgi:hypothetical protein